MFSVVIPLYNKELSISNTIQSVLDQTFQDFEIVIINDGSTDNSVKEVEKFDDKRIRLIHQDNQGVSAARNRGIEEARNEWIAFLDADDLWMISKLHKVQNIIKDNSNVEWIIHGYNVIRGNKKSFRSYNRTGFLDDILYDLNKGLVIQTSAVTVKKSC